MRISLYINGNRADLSDEVQILWTITRDSLDNPAVVANSYTQQVTLPGTPNNNWIFGYFYRTDFAADVADSARFNPLKRMPFYIINDRSECLQRGYLKLDSVQRKGETLYGYTVTLYGGLGDFFYHNTYNEDGSNKTLADLVYPTDRGSFDPKSEQFSFDANTVSYFWDYLNGDDNETRGAVINFAPAYNGVPSSGFSAGKAVYKPTTGPFGSGNMPNLYTTKTDGGKTYGTRKDADGYILVNLDKERTEWETQDLRAYLQRPVFRIKAMLEALALTPTGEWTFSATDAVLSIVQDLWVTLPMWDREKNPTDKNQVYYFSALLDDSATPMAYLLALAKTFGFVFRTDSTDAHVTMMTRDEYYSWSEVHPVDLQGRVSADGVEVTPYPGDKRFVTLQAPEYYGLAAKEYADKYGIRYGRERVDTGLEFNADEEDALKGTAFRGAPMVVERSDAFQVFGGNADSEYGTTLNYLCKFAMLGSISWTLYATDADGKEVTLECSPTEGGLLPFAYNQKTGGKSYDFCERVQLHDADNKEEAGSGVLLYFQGFRDFPFAEAGGHLLDEVIFHLTDDNAGMLALNDGIPCWDISPTAGSRITQLPLFSRCQESKNTPSLIERTLDFGTPREAFLGPEIRAFATTAAIYPRRWKRWLSDRYDVDTRVLKCRVDLRPSSSSEEDRGLQVSEDMLRPLYWFDNAWWSLQEVTNYDIVNGGPADCTFIKVQSVDNYDKGQDE